MKPVVILCVLGGEPDDPFENTAVRDEISSTLADAAKRLADMGYPVQFDGVATRMDDLIASAYAPDPETVLGNHTVLAALAMDHLKKVAVTNSVGVLAAETLLALRLVIRLLALTQVIKPGGARKLLDLTWSKRNSEDGSDVAMTRSDHSALAVAITAANMVARSAYRFVGG